MKGQTNEIINLTILIIIIAVIFLISYFITSKPQRETEEILFKRTKYSIISDAVMDFYYSKPLGADISYSQLLGYRLMAGKNPVYFGEFYPYVDVDRMITEFFNKYFGNDWYFEVSFRGDVVKYGKRGSSNAQVTEILIPVSSNNNIVSGYLYVWSD
jgi:hypothetical protein